MIFLPWVLKVTRIVRLPKYFTVGIIPPIQKGFRPLLRVSQAYSFCKTTYIRHQFLSLIKVQDCLDKRFVRKPFVSISRYIRTYYVYFQRYFVCLNNFFTYTKKIGNFTSQCKCKLRNIRLWSLPVKFVFLELEIDTNPWQYQIGTTFCQGRRRKSITG